MNVSLTANASEKKEYVVMTPDEEGKSYEISTELMSPYEVMIYKISNKDRIIDINGSVEASKQHKKFDINCNNKLNYLSELINHH